MEQRNRYWALIPAAGVGSRMKMDLPKQYLKARGKPILEYSLERFLNHSKIDGIVVVISTTDQYWASLSISDNQKIITAPGGKERCYSVMNGLKCLLSFADPDDWVLVHDAARPCLRNEDIDHLMDSVGNHHVGGILAAPVRDTMKRAGINNEIIETVERDKLWHALTPQMFRLGILTMALEKQINNNQEITDEAMAIELSGEFPLLVEGRADNIKITTIDDIATAEIYLGKEI